MNVEKLAKAEWTNQKLIKALLADNAFQLTITSKNSKHYAYLIKERIQLITYLYDANIQLHGNKNKDLAFFDIDSTLVRLPSDSRLKTT